MNNRYKFLIEKIEEAITESSMSQYSSMFPATVVDCGCGDGFGSSLLAKHPYWNVYAFDFDQKQVDSAHQKGVSSKQGDVRCLDLPSFFADIYVCSETLEHLSRDDSIKAAKDIHRITAAPGFIVVTVPADEKICLDNKKHKQYISSSDLELHFNFDDCIKVYEELYCKTPSRCNLVMIFRKLI